MKVQIGDLVIDTSEKEEMGITSIGYINRIIKTRSKSIPKDDRISYQVYWLNPDPGDGDCYVERHIDQFILEGVWQIYPVVK